MLYHICRALSAAPETRIPNFQRGAVAEAAKRKSESGYDMEKNKRKTAALPKRTTILRWIQICTDEHMHRRVDTPGTIHNACSHV